MPGMPDSPASQARTAGLSVVRIDPPQARRASGGLYGRVVRRSMWPAFAVAACAVLGPGAGRSVASSASAPTCDDLLSSASVEHVLGASAGHYAGPEVFGPRRCGWHTTDLWCTPRSLGVEVISADRLEQDAAGAPIRVDVVGLGDRAYFTTIETAVGMGAQIERLHVHDGTTWYRFSILGRLGDRGQEMLMDVAREVLSNVRRSA
jgi:hypothetical protein